MEFMEYRAYCVKQGQFTEELTLCKFWIREDGEIDVDNLPSKYDIAELLQALRLYDIHSEFTGKVDDDE